MIILTFYYYTSLYGINDIILRSQNVIFFKSDRFLENLLKVIFDVEQSKGLKGFKTPIFSVT